MVLPELSLLLFCGISLAHGQRQYYGSPQQAAAASAMPTMNQQVYVSGEVPDGVSGSGPIMMPPNPYAISISSLPPPPPTIAVTTTQQMYRPSTLPPPPPTIAVTTQPPQPYYGQPATTTTPPTIAVPVTTARPYYGQPVTTTTPPTIAVPVTTARTYYGQAVTTTPPTIAATTTAAPYYGKSTAPTVGTFPTESNTWVSRAVNRSGNWQDGSYGGVYGDGYGDMAPYGKNVGVYKYRYRPKGVSNIWRDQVLQNHRIHLLSVGSPLSSEETQDKKRINWVMRPECLPEVLRNQKRYICTLTGQLICLGGWRGRYCHIPICHNDCGPNGQCVEPGKCRCRVGYDGDHCERCIPLPGCKYGTCQKNYECNCMRGWTGTFCSIPMCRRGCNLRHATCQFPGECNCNPGMYGYNCDQCIKAPGCVHGSCQKPFQCVCEPGWKGPNCDERICNVECNHGQCRTPDQCECDIGWTGDKCDQCVPYPGCQNGRCSQPWECTCNEGWYGFFCNMTADMTTTPSTVGVGNTTSGSGWNAYYSNYYANYPYDQLNGTYGSGSYDGLSDGYAGDAGYDSYGPMDIGYRNGPMTGGGYGPNWQTIDLDNPDATAFNFTNLLYDIINQTGLSTPSPVAGGGNSYYNVGPSVIRGGSSSEEQEKNGGGGYQRTPEPVGKAPMRYQ